MAATIITNPPITVTRATDQNQSVPTATTTTIHMPARRTVITGQATLLTACLSESAPGTTATTAAATTEAATMAARDMASGQDSETVATSVMTEDSEAIGTSGVTEDSEAIGTSAVIADSEAVMDSEPMTAVFMMAAFTEVEDSTATTTAANFTAVKGSAATADTMAAHFTEVEASMAAEDSMVEVVTTATVGTEVEAVTTAMADITVAIGKPFSGDTSGCRMPPGRAEVARPGNETCPY